MSDLALRSAPLSSDRRMLSVSLTWVAGCVLLLVAPIFRGGNRWVVLIGLEWLGLLVLLGAAMTWMQGRRLHWGRGLRAALLLFLLGAPVWIAFVQLVPLPPDVWTALPGRALYRETLEVLGLWNAGWRPMSLTPDATRASALAGIPLVAAVALALTVQRHQVIMLGRLCAWMAVAQAGMGLIQLAPGGALQFGSFFGGAIGTFANSNHLASLLVMCIPWAVWEIHRSAHRSGRSRKESGRVWVWVVALLILLAGLVATGSRAGMALGVSVLAASLLFMPPGLLQRWSLSRRLMVVGPLMIAAMLGAGFHFLHRLGTSVSSDASTRLSMLEGTLTAARTFWPWGSGLGSFSQVFLRFQPERTSRNFIEHAHSDYAQLLMETGVLGLVCMLIALWLLLDRLVSLLGRLRVSHRSLGEDDGVLLTAGLGLAGLLLHAWVDFDLRIPALAMWGAFFFGLLMRQDARGARATDSELGSKKSTFN